MNSSTDHATPTIAFYVHHHGSGHLMRAISIATALQDMPICFLGSHLHQYADLIPDNVECIHLPMDIPAENEHHREEKPLSFLHYAPTGIAGIRVRTAILTETFMRNYPLLLVVDVSVEIAILARLCGIPTVVVRQHGNRDDLPHRQAYESAELILAPFSAAFASPLEEDWITAKTIYAGGFSKYSQVKRNSDCVEKSGNVAILIGQGGTSIDSEFIHFLAASCKAYTFHIIGNITHTDQQDHDHIKWYGNLADPLPVLSYCKVVIGNAGHNTVMEMADLNKRFICIPEERPFDEQQQKAALLAAQGYARVIQPEDLKLLNWSQELAAAENREPDWSGVTDRAALQNIADAIKHTIKKIF